MVAWPVQPTPPAYTGDGAAFNAQMVAWNIVYLPLLAAAMQEFEGDLEAITPAVQAALVQSGFKQAYNPLTAYQPGESTSYAGDLWLALTPNTGVTPAEGANWMRIPVKAPPRTGYIYAPSGRYIMPLDDLNAQSTAVLASTGFAIPFNRNVTIDALALYVSTGVGSSSIRLGIYASDGAGGGPGSLLFDLGTVATASSGAKTALIGSDYAVEDPIWLVLAQVGGTVPNLRQATRAGRGSWNQNGQDAELAVGCLRFTLNGASAFPATFPAVSLSETAAAFPIIYARTA